MTVEGALNQKLNPYICSSRDSASQWCQVSSWVLVLRDLFLCYLFAVQEYSYPLLTDWSGVWLARFTEFTFLPLFLIYAKVITTNLYSITVGMLILGLELVRSLFNDHQKSVVSILDEILLDCWGFESMFSNLAHLLYVSFFSEGSLVEIIFLFQRWCYWRSAENLSSRNFWFFIQKL